MSWVDGAWHRTRVFVRGERYAREQQEEIRIHLELEAQQHPLNGVAEARRRMGNLTGVQERLREAAGMAWFDRAKQDLTYAVRGLRRSPAFTITVVLTLALGVGANSAMFSFLDRVFFREPGGVTRPADLRRIYYFEHDPFGGPGSTRALQRFSYQEYEVMQRSMTGTDVAADIAASGLTSGPRRDSLPQTGFVSGNYFAVLGIRPAVGRFFSAEESRIDVDSRVAVISYAYWKRAFGLDPAVLHKSIQAYGKDYSIVGVTAQGFEGIDVGVLEMMLPLHAYPAGRSGKLWYEEGGGNYSPLRPIMRAPGRSDIRILAGASGPYREMSPQPTRRADTVTKLVSGPVIAARGPAENAKEVSLSARLAGVTIVVMLLACANIASLLLVRATKRRREIAVRLALGVTRKRLWSQLLTESLLLAGVGCGFALLVAQWAGTALRKLLLPANTWAGPALDTRVVVFTIMTAGIVGIIAGMFPAFQATHTELNDAMKSGASGGGSRRTFARSALLAAQGAMSIVLLVAAGLFIRTLGNVRSLPLGFDPERMIYAGVSTSVDSLGPRISLALNEAATRLASVPGVHATAVAADAPMAGAHSGFVALPDHPEVRLGASGNYVSSTFFTATGMPFVSGRGFTREEAENLAAVVVVNQSFARRAWPGENPLGKCLLVGFKATTCSSVIGVTQDARYIQIIEGRSTLGYFAPISEAAGAFYRPNYVIINADPAHAREIVKRASDELAQLLPGVGRIRVARSSESLAPQYRPWELGAELFTTFGFLALVVAAIGVYSVVAYSVSQRTREMGVRVALGARARDVLDLVVSEGMRVVAIGMGIGIVIALVLGKVIASQLFGVSTRDPFVIIGAASLLTGVALAACLIPAWRAARIDPMTALRTE